MVEGEDGKGEEEGSNRWRKKRKGEEGRRRRKGEKEEGMDLRKRRRQQREVGSFPRIQIIIVIPFIVIPNLPS